MSDPLNDENFRKAFGEEAWEAVKAESQRLGRKLCGDEAAEIVNRIRATDAAESKLAVAEDRARQAIAEVRRWYDESIFPPRPPGRHTEVYDGEAAAVARMTCDNILREYEALSTTPEDREGEQ